MPIPLHCVCGNRFNADDADAGLQVLCPECGQLLRATPGQEINSGFDVPDDDVILVTPDEDGSSEEVPEIEVEEFRVAAWDKAKKIRVQWDDDGPDDDFVPKKADARARPTASVFVQNLTAAGENGWASIGTVRLNEPTACMAFSGVGSWALAGQDANVAVLNMQQGIVADWLSSHQHAVTCAALSFDGESALTGDRHGNIQSWNLLTRQPRYARVGDRSPVETMAYSPNSALAAASDRNGAITLFDAETGDKRSLANANWSERATSLAFSPDNARLIAGGQLGLIQVWSVRSGRCMARFRPEKATVQSVRFAADGLSAYAALLTASVWSPRYPNIVRIDLKTGDEVACFLPGDAPTLAPDIVALDHRSKRVIIAGRKRNSPTSEAADSHLEVWDLSSVKRLHAFSDLQGEASGIAVSHGDNAIALAIREVGVQLFVMPAWDTLTARTPMANERRRRHDASDL